MLDKVSTVIIVILSLICVIIMGKWGYDYYMNECELYNENIVEFTIEMIKGNKSLEDIDSLDATDSVKDSLRTYYNDNFYFDNSLIVLSYDYKLLDELVNECIEFRENSMINGVFDEQIFNNFVMDAANKHLIDYYNSVKSDEDFADSPPEFESKYFLWDYSKKDVNDFEVKEDSLCISLSKLYFTDGECIKYYKGYPISIYRDALDKKIISEIQISEKYQSISVKNIIEDGKIVDYIVKDYLSNDYSFTVGLNKGKIESLTFR